MELFHKGMQAETLYAFTIKLWQTLGKSHHEVWSTIHAIEEKHGLYKNGHVDVNYKVRTINLSEETVGEIKSWTERESKEIGLRALAKSEGIKLYILTDFYYSHVLNSKILLRGANKEKALKSLCEKYNIEWKED